MIFLSYICFAFRWLNVQLDYLLKIEVRVASSVDLRCEIDLVDMCVGIVSLTLYRNGPWDNSVAVWRQAYVFFQQ